MILRQLPALLIVVVLGACSPGSPRSGGGLITGHGTHPSPGGTSHLVIGSKPTSLVDYKIVHVATGRESAPDRLFSEVMRWSAYWQDDDTLWVHSSDIGLSVWKRNSSGQFSQEWLGERSELVATIPEVVWDQLPSVLQRKWKSLRGTD